MTSYASKMSALSTYLLICRRTRGGGLNPSDDLALFFRIQVLYSVSA